MINPSKKESIEVLDKVIAFTEAAIQAFNQLKTRSQILRASISHNSNDPISNDSMGHFEILIKDWGLVASDLDKRFS